MQTSTRIGQPALGGESQDSALGEYRPELLLLAPEGGEGLNSLSLVAQFLELGVSIELDENWPLPVGATSSVTSERTPSSALSPPPAASGAPTSRRAST